MWDDPEEEAVFYCYACGRQLLSGETEDAPGCDQPHCLEMFLETNRHINTAIERADHVDAGPA